jgi:hypothetical protein
MTWVLEETQQPGVYQFGFFGDSRRRGRSGNARDKLKLWTSLVGTLDQFEELGRALVGDVTSLRAGTEPTEDQAAG